MRALTRREQHELEKKQGQQAQRKPFSLAYWQLFGGLLVLANLAYFLHSIIGWVITLSFFLLVPGFLFLKFFIDTKWSRWERLSFSLGLSILFCMVVGLALNALDYVGLDRPLETFKVFTALNISTLVLIAIHAHRRVQFKFNPGYRLFSARHVLLGLPLAMLPLLAIGGAIRLNNGASNILTLILFAAIAVIFVVLIVRRDLQRYYPAALFVFAVSILLSVSLRGEGITGHDIQREFAVFELTMRNAAWNIAEFRDPYNACLSITILPVMLANLTGISDPYIFKVVFQIIAATAVIPIYFFIVRLHGTRDALLASFIFLLFPTFLNDMPMLNRQEIAFLFFGLIMLLMVLAVEQKRLQWLTIILIVGLTLSHYSSSYITLGLMLCAWLIHFIVIRITKPKFATERVNRFPILKLPIIVIACVFVVLWNDQITQTSQGLNSTLDKTLAGLFSGQLSQAADVGYSIVGGKTAQPDEILNQYSQKFTHDNVAVSLIEQPSLPLTSLGKTVDHVVPVESANRLVRDLIAKLLQVLLIVGCAVLWWRIRKKRHGKYDLYVLSLCGGCAVLLVALTVLPQLSIDYGVLRLFQQLLFILALPIIAALVWLASRVTKNPSVIYVSAGVFLAGIFLHTSGFIPQVTGGYNPQLSLNSAGHYYDAYYASPSEQAAADWHCARNTKNAPTALDIYAPSRLSDACKDQLVTTSPMADFSHAYLYEYGPNVRRGAFMVNINSNLYYYAVDRSGYRQNQLYDAGTSRVQYLTKED